jgi:hypothetical protein
MNKQAANDWEWCKDWKLHNALNSEPVQNVYREAIQAELDQTDWDGFIDKVGEAMRNNLCWSKHSEVKSFLGNYIYG